MSTDLFQRSLYIFMSVADEGSFSAAGRKLHMTQAAISQQIDNLEGKLSFKLFDRTGYRPALTPAGMYFYGECTKLAAQYKVAEQIARDKAESAALLLKIGITGPFEEKHLPVIIRKYHMSYANVETDIKICTFIEGIRGLEQNTLDIAFGITNDFKNRKNLQCYPLFRHTICVICAKNHPFAQKKEVEGKELANQPLISFSNSTGNIFLNDFKKSFELDGVKPEIVRETDNLNELILAVKLNQGIALLAQVVIPRDPDLRAIPLVHTHHHAEFCAGISKTNTKSYLMPFIRTAQDYFTLVR